MFNILSNKLSKTILDIPCEDNHFSIVLNTSDTKYKWNKNTLNISSNIKSKLSSYTCKYDLDDSKSIDKLSNLANKYIKDEINNLINIQNKNKIDFLGFKLYIYKHDKDYLKEENNYKVNINVNTTINSIGEIR